MKIKSLQLRLGTGVPLFQKGHHAEQQHHGPHHEQAHVRLQRAPRLAPLPRHVRREPSGRVGNAVQLPQDVPSVHTVIVLAHSACLNINYYRVAPHPLLRRPSPPDPWHAGSCFDKQMWDRRSALSNILEFMELSNSSSCLSDQERDCHREYFESEVSPVFSALMTSIVKSKPEDILEFCTRWFRDRKGDPNKKKDPNEDSDEDADKFGTMPEEEYQLRRQRVLKRGNKKRCGVTSEVYGPCARRQSIKLSTGSAKDEHTHMRLLFFCQNSFLFRNFSQTEMGLLVKMMNKRVTVANEVVFEEGEWGDSIYFVDEGFFECVQQSESGPRSIRFYHVGDTFGEICLLHLIKRQASIISRSDGILYTLNRESYIHYKKMCITKRRAIYTYTLKKQPLFSKFCEEELDKICDVLVEVTFEEGELIINQGDMGSKFYIILDGILVAFKDRDDNIVQCYKEGDAFGEIALIKDTPRQASVKSLTRSRLVYMTQEVFRRIFQNVNLEKQIEEKYGAIRSNLVTRRRDNQEQGHKTVKTLKSEESLAMI